MLSILDIILISLGGACIITYATLKFLQLRKFKQSIKYGIEHGLTEEEARKNAYEAVYQKAEKTKKDKAPDVNDNDNIYED